MQDAFDLCGSKERTRSTSATDAVHSARSHGRANHDGSCRPNARQHRFAMDFGNWSAFWLDAETLHRTDDLLIEARAAIKDQVARRRVIGECLTQLLNNPGTARMLGHVAVKDTPSIMREDEEAVKHAEGERRHGEEIHCSNRFTMVFQKRHPSLRRI